jgi:hypothetical protein
MLRMPENINERDDLLYSVSGIFILRRFGNASVILYHGDECRVNRTGVLVARSQFRVHGTTRKKYYNQYHKSYVVYHR